MILRNIGRKIAGRFRGSESRANKKTGPETMALYVTSMRTTHSSVDGEIIGRDGARWSISIGPNDQGDPNSSLLFTRIE